MTLAGFKSRWMMPWLGFLERQGQGADQSGGGVRRPAAIVGHQRRQWLALDVGHRHQMDAIDLANLVDGHDVRVLKSAGRARLAVEALQGAGILGHALGHLERDLAAELRIVGQVDRAHAAATEQLQNPVAADALRHGLLLGVGPGFCRVPTRGVLGRVFLVGSLARDRGIAHGCDRRRKE